MSKRIDIESQRVSLDEIAAVANRALESQPCGISGKSNVELIADLRAERDAWHTHYKQAEESILGLMERNKALQARVDACDMREIVGELRAIYVNAEASNESAVKAGLRVLLRKIDLESQL